MNAEEIRNLISQTLSELVKRTPDGTAFILCASTEVDPNTGERTTLTGTNAHPGRALQMLCETTSAVARTLSERVTQDAANALADLINETGTSFSPTTGEA